MFIDDSILVPERFCRCISGAIESIAKTMRVDRTCLQEMLHTRTTELWGSIERYFPLDLTFGLDGELRFLDESGQGRPAAAGQQTVGSWCVFAALSSVRRAAGLPHGLWLVDRLFGRPDCEEKRAVERILTSGLPQTVMALHAAEAGRSQSLFESGSVSRSFFLREIVPGFGTVIEACPVDRARQVAAETIFF